MLRRDREAARVKVRMVTEEMKQLKLEKAAALVEGVSWLLNQDQN